MGESRMRGEDEWYTGSPAKANRLTVDGL